MTEPTARVAVVGGGFAGLWAAAAAAAVRAEHDADVDVVLVSADPALTVRPRLYELDLGDVRVELRPVLEPAGVTVVEGRVSDVDAHEGVLVVEHSGAAASTLPFDRMVLAAGSRLRRAGDPAIDRLVHSIDTFAEATAFRNALEARRASSPGRPVEVVVVGAGLTGLELATELAALPGVHATLLDRAPDGPRSEAGALVASALDTTGVAVRRGAEAVAVADDHTVLRDGSVLASDLVVWAGGMEASPLAGVLGAERDDLGRLFVDEHLAVHGQPSVYAAGDIAHVVVDGVHVAPMSCQFAIPTGRVAGHNAAASLLGLPEVAFEEPSYVTCIDLGSWGALFTRGWERTPDRVGESGKKIKQRITRELIYPPTDPAELLAAASIGRGQSEPMASSPSGSVSPSTSISR